MELRRIAAPDMRKAMSRVREEIGEDAVILSSEMTPDGVTILASDGKGHDPAQLAEELAKVGRQNLDAAAKKTSVDSTASAALPEQMRQALARGPLGYGQVSPQPTGRGFAAVLRGAVGATTKSIKNWASQQASSRKDVESVPPLHLAAGTATVEPAVNRMRDELGSMRKMIERELGQLAEDRLRSVPTRAIAIDLMEDFGCGSALTAKLAAKIPASLPEDGVRSMVRLLVEEMAPMAGEDLLAKGGIVALVGPTGAGKTTTAAKLAARYAAKHGTRDVALVTIDQHRAAAREQLQAHGRRLGITVVEADGPAALTDALKQLRDYPLVIIDTAGLSPRDMSLSSHLNLLREQSSLRALLTLPANGNGKDLLDVVRAYSVVRPEGIVLTKADETPRLGGAIDCSVSTSLPIAFVCNGQSVPDDIVRATPSLLSAGLERLSDATDHLMNPTHAVA